jgi:hypothetical protein
LTNKNKTENFERKIYQKYLIHGFGEAIEVINGVIAINNINSWFFGIPMARNNKNGFRSFFENLLPCLQEFPRWYAFIDRHHW